MIARAGRRTVPARHPPDATVVAAYRVLQLLHTAPNDLVEAVYWRLVDRARASGLEEFAYIRRIDELNRASATIAAASHNVAPSPMDRTGRGRKGSVAPPTTSLYAALHLDPCADADIIELAARHATGHRPRTREEAAFRDAALVAAATLCNPVLRARHDAEMGIGQTPQAGPVEEGRPHSSVQEAAPAVAIPPTTIPTPLRVDPREPAAGDPLPPEEIESPQSLDPPAVQREIPSAPAEPPVALAAELPEAAPDHAPAEDPSPRPAHEGLVARFWSRGRNHRAAAEAENDRLLALRTQFSEGVVANQALPAPPGLKVEACSPPGARLVFVEGPDSGSISITQAATDEDEHDDAVALDLPTADGLLASLRFWLRDGALMLHHVDGPAPSVAGAVIGLPIIMLEDGDEIATGAARVRVEITPA